MYDIIYYTYKNTLKSKYELEAIVAVYMNVNLYKSNTRLDDDYNEKRSCR